MSDVEIQLTGEATIKWQRTLVVSEDEAKAILADDEIIQMMLTQEESFGVKRWGDVYGSRSLVTEPLNEPLYECQHCHWVGSDLDKLKIYGLEPHQVTKRCPRCEMRNFREVKGSINKSTLGESYGSN